jgi:hypothetical protein
VTDLDTWWRHLGSAALVGTSRRAAPSVADVPLVGAVVADRADARPEQAALDAAALGAVLRRAGRLPEVAAVAVPAAPPDRHPQAPPRARQLLTLLLEQPPADRDGTGELLRHWCEECRATGHRVPHALLPALLDRAASDELRAVVSGVLDARGHWLAAQCPSWSWVPRSSALQGALDRIAREFGPAAKATRDSDPAAASVDPQRWALGSTDERVAQLRRLRYADPAAGRDLLATTWSTDNAKDRRVLLESLHVGLGPDDEEVLERALDDRAASVRDRAAELLDALPTSRRAARMAERLRPLIRETGLLRKQLEVALPDDPDAAGRRDGLGKPPAGRSARGWWLERIVAGAPLDAWGTPAATVVARVSEPDVLAGLRAAAVARRSEEWARALLGRDAVLAPGEVAELLGALPTAEREEAVIARLGRGPMPAPAVVVGAAGMPWSPRLSRAVVDHLARLRPEQVGLALEHLLPRMVRGLHTDAVPALQAWRERAQLARRHDQQLGSLIQSRTLKQTISEAFRP